MSEPDPLLETLSLQGATLSLPDERKAGLVRKVLDLRTRETGTTRSNVHGWHSARALYEYDDADFRWLVDSIYNASKALLRRTGVDLSASQLGMTECWVNINDAGSWNTPHVHLPNDWAGVFYLSVDEALAHRQPGDIDGDIMFINLLPPTATGSRPAYFGYTPRDGQLFLFPAAQVHMVAPHQAPVPRISVAFNYRLLPANRPPG